MGIVEDRKKALEEANKAAKATKASDSTGITTGKLSPTLLAAAIRTLDGYSPITTDTHYNSDSERSKTPDSTIADQEPTISNTALPPPSNQSQTTIFDQDTLQYARQCIQVFTYTIQDQFINKKLLNDVFTSRASDGRYFFFC